MILLSVKYVSYVRHGGDQTINTEKDTKQRKILHPTQEAKSQIDLSHSLFWDFFVKN